MDSKAQGGVSLKQKLSEAGKIGGKVMAAVQRQAAIEDYHRNPSLCLKCKGVIPVNDRKVSTVRKQKFCNRSCAAKYNNEGVRRHPPRTCKSCGISVTGKSHRQYCSADCRAKAKAAVPPLTKGELFARRSNWQSARSEIQRSARNTFLAANPEPACEVCGYQHHVEVAHRRAVSDFPSEATLGEINNLSNLVGLCPNHHWEFDHGLLKL